MTVHGGLEGLTHRPASFFLLFEPTRKTATESGSPDVSPFPSSRCHGRTAAAEEPADVDGTPVLAEALDQRGRS